MTSNSRQLPAFNQRRPEQAIDLMPAKSQQLYEKVGNLFTCSAHTSNNSSVSCSVHSFVAVAAYARKKKQMKNF